MLKIFRFVVIVWLGLMAFALLLLGFTAALISAVWSLLRGRKPAVFTVTRSFTMSSKGFRHEPKAPPRSTFEKDLDAGVVDVESREVQPLLPGQNSASRE